MYKNMSLYFKIFVTNDFTMVCVPYVILKLEEEITHVKTIWHHILYKLDEFNNY